MSTTDSFPPLIGEVVLTESKEGLNLPQPHLLMSSSSVGAANKPFANLS